MGITTGGMGQDVGIRRIDTDKTRRSFINFTEFGDQQGPTSPSGSEQLEQLRSNRSRYYRLGTSIYETPRFVVPPHVEVIDDQMKEISALEAGWDSYKAPKIEVDITDEVKGIMLAVAGYGLPDPWVAAGADGGVGLQWDIGNTELYIEVLPGKPTGYLLTVNAGTEGEQDVDEYLTLKNLGPVLSRFAKAIS